MGTVNTVTLVAQLITSHRSTSIMRSFKFLTFLFLLGAASAAPINVNDEGAEVAAEEEDYDEYSYNDYYDDEYDEYGYEEERTMKTTLKKKKRRRKMRKSALLKMKKMMMRTTTTKTITMR